jgi:hypothetical protein
MQYKLTRQETLYALKCFCFCFIGIPLFAIAVFILLTFTEELIR